MIKQTETARLPLFRRQVLKGIAAAGAAGVAGLPAWGAAAAAEVRELIVLTGTTPWLPAYQKAAAAYEAEKGVKITFRPSGLKNGAKLAPPSWVICRAFDPSASAIQSSIRDGRTIRWPRSRR